MRHELPDDRVGHQHDRARDEHARVVREIDADRSCLSRLFASLVHDGRIVPATRSQPMRVWGVPKTGWIISVCVAGVLTGAVTWLPATRATADCNAEAPADDTVQRIHATKVVVR